MIAEVLGSLRLRSRYGATPFTLRFPRPPDPCGSDDEGREVSKKSTEGGRLTASRSHIFPLAVPSVRISCRVTTPLSTHEVNEPQAW